MFYNEVFRGVDVDLTRTGGNGVAGENDTIRGVEQTFGGGKADRLSGNDDANILDGADGNDVLKGRSGADELRGDEGRNRLDGGAGADELLLNAEPLDRDRPRKVGTNGGRAVCGDGNDTVDVVFLSDFVASDCDRVDIVDGGPFGAIVASEFGGASGRTASVKVTCGSRGRCKGRYAPRRGASRRASGRPSARRTSS